MDKRLLLALGIVEWAGVSSHLETMRSAGIDVSPVIEREVGRELGVLCTNWAAITGETSLMASVKSARTYVTENLEEAERVLA